MILKKLDENEKLYFYIYYYWESIKGMIEARECGSCPNEISDTSVRPEVV